MGATRVETRLDAAMGEQVTNIVRFAPCQSVPYGGVLFLLPFLLANGLLSYSLYYSQRERGYYNFDIVVLGLAFMYLCRIKNIEQLKHHSPGELGKLLGLDRIPEARCFRMVLKELSEEEQASRWGAYLSQEWINKDDVAIYYVDGHIQVYHGYLANLGKKHVSRQKLCLPGTVEFWVNNAEGMPYFYITGQVNEKLQQALEEEIIPRLNSLQQSKNATANKKEEGALSPFYTLVFDREAYSPKFFEKIWQQYHVAVITYRKNVKDRWDEEAFETYKIETEMGEVEMSLCEQQVELNGVTMREIRKRNNNEHQTSVITTNYQLSTEKIAMYMFARWSQENFFRYMRQEYDLDRIIQYGVDELDKNIKVVNREYSNLTCRLKKIREKISRRQSNLYVLEEENAKTGLEKQSAQNIAEQQELVEELTSLREEEKRLISQRKKHPYKIPVGKMAEDQRYNKLKTESRHLQNIIKMICYRAETAMANVLGSEYKKSNNEIRALIKSLIFTQADINPDYEQNTLTVTLYSLSSQRDNRAVANLCNVLNETETLYPETDLKLIFKNATF
ncbi:MAG: putative transposase [Bacteroidota bacterium]